MPHHRALMRLVALIVLALACAPQRRVLAEQPMLHWLAVAGCPHEGKVRDSIRRSSVSTGERALRSVRAQVSRADDQYLLELWLEAPSGTYHKRFAAQHCSTFVELIALEIQLAASVISPPPPVPERAGTTLTERAWGLRAGGLVGSGPTPRPAPGVGLALSFGQRRMLVEVVANYFIPIRVQSSAAREVSARFDQVGVEARGCYAQPMWRLSLPFCAGAEVGMMRGAASGVERATDVRRLSASVFAAPGVRMPIGGSVWLWLELGVWIGVRRPSFAVRNLPVLYRPDLISARGGAGLAVKFE